MNIKILVATHKPYIMPKDKSLYMPVQLGCDEVVERYGYQCDNIGDNISYKHKYYSDLSSVYWGWKNLDVEYMGTCHYRRYFVSKIKKENEIPFFQYILSREEIEKILIDCPVIVAKKRNYYIETIESHYKHTHIPSDFDTLRRVIHDLSSDYDDSFEKVAQSKSAHMFNTFIMRKDFVDSFCSFMFPILFEVERRIDFNGRTEYESRTCGYLAEFLLDTWIIKNGIRFQEIELRVLDGEKKVKKAIAMLKAKYLGQRYDKSF